MKLPEIRDKKPTIFLRVLCYQDKSHKPSQSQKTKEYNILSCAHKVRSWKYLPTALRIITAQ